MKNRNSKKCNPIGTGSREAKTFGSLLSLLMLGNVLSGSYSPETLYGECATCTANPSATIRTATPLQSSGVCSACGPVCAYTPPTYRVVCETVYDEKKVVAYKPVWETELRTRPVTVQKKVVETEMREERYTVRIPVTEIQMQEKSEERVRYVPETCEREEISYCMKPVQKIIEQEKVCVVQKPVCETTMETRTRTINEQVTSYETKYVDQGAFTDQLVLKPNHGLFGHKLAFQEPKAVTNETTGEVTKQRGGLYWTPSNKGKYEVQKIWVPNPQPVQVPRTYTVPKQVCEQVPVTTTRMVEERVVTKVPVTVTEMVREQVVKKVPVTTMKPVKEVVVNKVPVKVCTWKEEERVRQIPYTTWKMVDECSEETYEVKVCRMVPEEKVVRVPRIVTRYVPIDACGNDILSDSPIVPPAPAFTVPSVNSQNQEAPTVETPTSSVPAQTESGQNGAAIPVVPPQTPNVKTLSTPETTSPYTPETNPATNAPSASAVEQTNSSPASEAKKTFAEKRSILESERSVLNADSAPVPSAENQSVKSITTPTAELPAVSNQILPPVRQ